LGVSAMPASPTRTPETRAAERYDRPARHCQTSHSLSMLVPMGQGSPTATKGSAHCRLAVCGPSAPSGALSVPSMAWLSLPSSACTARTCRRYDAGPCRVAGDDAQRNRRYNA
jgi:hypothetical protein